jgi:hypothetical protein
MLLIHHTLYLFGIKFNYYVTKRLFLLHNKIILHIFAAKLIPF